MTTPSEDAEIDALLETVLETSGFDYREYARGSLRRRIQNRVDQENLGGIAQLRERVARDGACLERLHVEIARHETAMFRNPGFYRALRERVIPFLRTYPFVSIWCAACSTAEHVYAIAIVLRESGLSGRARIYATDANDTVLSTARRGVYPLAALRDQEGLYREAGGNSTLSEYYVEQGDQAVLRPLLRDQVVFAQHNVGTDASFHEFQLILCRDAMIYWQPQLQARVFTLFHRSLCRLGILAIGKQESLELHPDGHGYEPLDEEHKIFRRFL